MIRNILLAAAAAGFVLAGAGVRAEDVNVNSARGNKYYDTSDPGDRNYSNPATPEALLAATDTDSWEPPRCPDDSDPSRDTCRGDSRLLKMRRGKVNPARW